MNNPDDSLSDKRLDEALEPLRSVALPEETHEANLAAIHRALESQIQPSWWSRSVAVPVPLAIAATVAFALTAGALLKPWMMPDGIRQEAPKAAQAELASNIATPTFAEDYGADPPWSITQTYIHSLVNLQVFETSTLKENRDDS